MRARQDAARPVGPTRRPHGGHPAAWPGPASSRSPGPAAPEQETGGPARRWVWTTLFPSLPRPGGEKGRPKTPWGHRWTSGGGPGYGARRSDLPSPGDTSRAPRQARQRQDDQARPGRASGLAGPGFRPPAGFRVRVRVRVLAVPAGQGATAPPVPARATPVRPAMPFARASGGLCDHARRWRRIGAGRARRLTPRPTGTGLTTIRDPGHGGRAGGWAPRPTARPPSPGRGSRPRSLQLRRPKGANDQQSARRAC